MSNLQPSLRRWTVLVFALLLATVLGGCSRRSVPTVEVSGTILRGKIWLDDQPVKIGFVRAFDEAGNPVGSPGQISNVGVYVIPGVTAGKVLLSVERPPMMGPMKGPADFKAPPPPKDVKAPPGPPPPVKGGPPQELLDLMKTIENLPPRYSLPDKSGLSTTIKEGENEYDIKMTSK